MLRGRDRGEDSRMGQLVVAAGLATRTGRRPDNQDFCAATLGSALERATHGVIAVLADGVGGAKGGRIAAELACRSFIGLSVPARNPGHRRLRRSGARRL
jgi:serine/threonine protein phosphatase PrpC